MDEPRALHPAPAEPGAASPESPPERPPAQRASAAVRSLRERLARAVDRLPFKRRPVLFLTALVVGASTGLGATAFIELIGWVQRLFFERGSELVPWLGLGLVVVAPVVGGLLAGPIVARFAPEARGHGVPEVMQAVALRGGRIRPRVVLAKIAASALCIGSGGSCGREGPIVQVGSALGSTIGVALGLPAARVRNLVACGAAAGIAATFNAPIAGTIFAMEIVLGDFAVGDLGNVVISAVTASTVARIFLGDSPAFAIPKYALQSPSEILAFAALGVLAALVAVGFIRLLYWSEDRFEAWKAPESLKPAVGGLLLGALALATGLVLQSGVVPPAEAAPPALAQGELPYLFGSGFPVIGSALLGDLSLGLLVLLVLLKPLATAMTLGSGNSGGIFAPTLFTGAALGGAFGLALERFAPGTTAGPGAYAVVGMAAVFAGAARAPLTAILIVFEMTNDYRLILPLMAGVIMSLIVATLLHQESIYTLKLVRRGIRLVRGQDVDVMASVRVEEVMLRNPVGVRPDVPLPELFERFLGTGRHGFPVLGPDGALIGIVTLGDYRRAAAREGVDVSTLRVEDVFTRDVLTVTPDDSVGTALRRMAPRDLSRLPVVDANDPRRLVGMVRRNDIVRAYELGVLRREAPRPGAGEAAGAQ